MNKRELRISDKERNDYLSILESNFAEGRLTITEFDSRSKELIESKTHGEVEKLFTDLLVTPSDKTLIDQEKVESSKEHSMPMLIGIMIISFIVTTLIIRIFPYLILLIILIAIISIIKKS